jgi:OFA family oxalate/formate antiporter-like MFS transporter
MQNKKDFISDLENKLMETRWMYPALGLLILSMMGGIYAFSLYYSPLQQAYGLESISQLAFAFSLITISYSLFIIPAGVFYDRTGPRIPVLLGALLIFLGYLIGWFMQNIEDWNIAMILYYIGLGILPGFGIAVIDAVPRPLAAKWFPDRTGTAVGIVAFGFGIGAAVVTPVIRYFLSITDVFHTFLYMGTIYFIIIASTGLLLREPPVNYMRKDDVPEFSLSRALRDRRFHILWLSFAFSSFAGLMVIGNAVPILEEGISEQEVISAFLIITSFFNAGGRILWGTILDRTGAWRAMEMNFLITAITLFAISYGYRSPVSVILLGGLIYANYGGLLALFPSATAIFFGKKYLGRIYGAVFTSWGVAGLLGALSGGLIKDLTGSYVSSFYFAMAMSLLAALLVYLGSKYYQN